MSKNIADLNTFLHENFREHLRPNENAVECAMRLITMFDGTAKHLEKQAAERKKADAEEYDKRRLRDSGGTDQTSRKRLQDS